MRVGWRYQALRQCRWVQKNICFHLFESIIIVHSCNCCLFELCESRAWHEKHLFVSLREHHCSQLDTALLAAFSMRWLHDRVWKDPARHELFRMKKKLLPEVQKSWLHHCGLPRKFWLEVQDIHPNHGVKTWGLCLLEVDKLSSAGYIRVKKSAKIFTDALLSMQTASSDRSGHPHHLLCLLLWPPWLEAGEHGGDHDHHDGHAQHGGDGGGVGGGGGQDGGAVGGEEEQEQEP